LLLCHVYMYSLLFVVFVFRLEIFVKNMSVIAWAWACLLTILF